MAFCNFYSEEKEKAAENFQRALALNQDFFWYYYNLGIISLERSNYQGAAIYFNKAVAQNPKKTLLYIVGSKIYRDILRLSDIKAAPDQELNKGIRRARELLKAVSLLENKPDEKLKNILVGHLRLQLF